MRLELREANDADAVDAACAARALPVDAADILWMAPVGRPPGDNLGAAEPAPAVTLQGIFAAASAVVSDVEWRGFPETPPAEWSAPRPPESLPSPGGPRTAPPTLSRSRSVSHASERSAWIWAPDAWRLRADRIWDVAKTEHLTGIFVTVPVREAAVEHPEPLEDFIRAARRRGIAVWAVVGDPHDVLPEARPALLNRAQAYAAYNDAVEPAGRLAGLQLDVEPYLLPGFVLSPGAWRERYLDMLANVHAAVAGRLPLDLVVPVWWGSHPEWGAAFLQGMARPGVSLTVMNYRTHAEALRAGARPFLEAGVRHGYKVRIALETGPLPDEARRAYRRADAGHPAALWLTEVQGVPVLILLAAPRDAFPGVGYAFSHETIAPADNLTFGSDRVRREKTAEPLERAWRRWKSFAGLALHGLDAGFP